MLHKRSLSSVEEAPESHSSPFLMEERHHTLPGLEIFNNNNIVPLLNLGSTIKEKDEPYINEYELKAKRILRSQGGARAITTRVKEVPKKLSKSSKWVSEQKPNITN